MTDDEQTGIISEVRIGMEDDYRFGPALFFTIWTSAGTAFGTHIGWEELGAILKERKVGDLTKFTQTLEGHPCYYHMEGGIGRFVRLWSCHPGRKEE